MNWKFENFKKGPLSTIVGALLMGAAVYVFLQVPNSEVFALALLGLGGLAFGLKDPKLPGGPGSGAAMLTICVLSFFIQGCVTYQKCLDKFGSLAKDSVRVPVKVILNDTIKVFVKGDTLQGTINDSLLNLLKRNQGDTIRETSQSGKLKIKFWYDKYRHELEYRANLEPDTVEYIVHDTVRVMAVCPPAVVFNPLGKLPWYAPAKLWDRFKLFAAWTLVAAVLTFLAYSKLHRS